MKIVLSGASGLIGPRLADALRGDGHELLTLVRGETSGPDEARWDPASGQLDAALLADAGAVVCLNGVGVADKRWTEKYKKLIVSSRVDSVSTIARALVESGSSAALIAASAVGYYGDTGAREVDETAPPGDSFLAGVCQLWEDAAQPARDAGLRVAHLRTGLVLAKGDGLLKPLALVTKAGIGGKLGTGKQYFPWISITDEVDAIRFVVENEVAGPVNLTGPTPVTNEVFTKALGRVLHRPTIFPVPSFAAKVVLGEFAWNALTGQNAVPAVLRGAGFEFTHSDVESALRAELS